MQFIDEATIHVKAGDGGNGCVAFRREAHVPRGGPSGGDGGDGGSVVMVANPQLTTLLDFKYRRHYNAPRGQDGRNKDQYGKAGDDLLLQVPVGTVVHDGETGDQLADLTEAGARFVAAQGGRGGQGNMHFATPWNRAPRTAQPGTPGDQRTLRLELKLLADVGLLGFPNVGKSTFIAHVSRARPKIADYPFTTLQPNLGVVDLGQERALVVADIPGLIEGAAEGAGLGHRFLRHVERTRVLVHILDASVLAGPDRDPVSDFDTLNAELARYAPDLAARPQIVALNKLDVTEVRERFEELQNTFATRGIRLHGISAATGDGLKDLLEEVWRVSQLGA
ncbi:MAG TPA: GTPase ObgE [Kofleriaceae bacterium]|nr:GTPase ObgE [Kofleriaceae bacterium]